MKRFVIITLFALSPLATFAQSNKTVETQKDRYGHITGTATTTTDSRGNQKTVYKDQYGHITGTSEARPTLVDAFRQLTKTDTGISLAQVRHVLPMEVELQQLIKIGMVTLRVQARPKLIIWGSLLRLTKTNMDIYRVQAIRIDNDSKNRVAIQ